MQVIKYKKREPGSRMKRAYIRRLMLTNGEPNALAYPIPLLESKLAQANEHFKLVSEEADSRRESFLKLLDNENAKLLGTTAVKQAN